MTLEQCEDSLSRNARSHKERARIGARVRKEQARIGARVSARSADEYYWHRDFAQALQFYGRALRQDLWMPKIWVKWFLLRLGGVGVRFRGSLSGLRQMMAGTKSNQ
jgi:hypothetical protein